MAHLNQTRKTINADDNTISVAQIDDFDTEYDLDEVFEVEADSPQTGVEALV